MVADRLKLERRGPERTLKIHGSLEYFLSLKLGKNTTHLGAEVCFWGLS